MLPVGLKVNEIKNTKMNQEWKIDKIYFMERSSLQRSLFSLFFCCCPFCNLWYSDNQIGITIMDHFQKYHNTLCFALQNFA